MDKRQGVPTSVDGVMRAAVAFMKQCEPYMERFRDREALKREISLIENKGKNLTTAVKHTGMNRQIDELGRMVIPAELRRSLGISEGTPMEIFLDEANGTVYLQKYEMKTCFVCSSADDVNSFKGKFICETCIGDLFDEIN